MWIIQKIDSSRLLSTFPLNTQSQIFQLYGGIVGLFIFPKTLYSDYLIRNNIFFPKVLSYSFGLY